MSTLASITTPEVAALRKLEWTIDARWVDWAVRMLVAGRDTPALRELAGEREPFNQFEMRPLVDRVISELGLAQVETLERAAIVIATVLARRYLANELSAKTALATPTQLYIELGHEGPLDLFYYLYHAWDDVLSYDTVRYYWPEADRDNIEAVVHAYLVEWCEQHSDV